MRNRVWKGRLAFDVFSGTEYLKDPNPNCEITCRLRVALKQSTNSGFSSFLQNFQDEADQHLR